MGSFSLEKDLRLPRGMRRSLGRVYGRIIREDEIKRQVSKARRIYAVGDVVVSAMLRRGSMPDVAIFDFRVGRKRVVYKEIRDAFKRPITVKNKAGTISKGLWEAIKHAGGAKNPVGIRVYGEEDLAAVACAYLAPKGSVILYGLPGRGVDLVKVTPKVKNQVVGILVRMASA